MKHDVLLFLTQGQRGRGEERRGEERRGVGGGIFINFVVAQRHKKTALFLGALSPTAEIVPVLTFWMFRRCVMCDEHMRLRMVVMYLGNTFQIATITYFCYDV